ncbi:hypothetical protein EWM62_15680 [Mucilaginibacter terrigena]|uniref:Uncharacterized protein n=1 Tax=Mucilaginibacter terrigena TaxID=2492395 RepID=A0A4Q5LK90_9SPHI|nr:hypothetical protein [Mucilaginibacter terrigena]RYU87931.1 hypothetical protein EWM62_15680 [Mucilaginibacter terrigena]
MTVIDVITWTCAAVFILTAAITLLSVLNLIKIEPQFREKLFYALLIEIVVGSVAVFNTNVSNSHLNIIRVSNPKDGTTTRVKPGDNFFINGVCAREPGASFEGEIKIKNKEYKLVDFNINNRDIFTASAVLDSDTLQQTPMKISVRLISKGKIIYADTSTTNIIISRQ